MNFCPTTDLWQTLTRTDKTVVMYGMGNGADKILKICERKGIAIADFFASDGFVRGHSFHGKTVLSYSAVKEKYGAENLIVTADLSGISATAGVYTVPATVYADSDADVGIVGEYEVTVRIEDAAQQD